MGEKEKSWAELAAERQQEKDALYEFEIVAGQPKFKFRKLEMLDCIEAGALPEEMIAFIYERYIEGTAGRTEEEIKKNVVEQFQKHMTVMLSIACNISVDPKLTMDQMVNGKDEFPVKLLSQDERFKLIQAISKITMERAEALRPFRVQPADETDQPDGEDVPLPAVGDQAVDA